MPTTLGRLMVEETLPDEFKGISEALSKDEVDNILTIVAKKYPDRYKDISAQLMRIGAQASFDEGITLNLKDLESPIADREKRIVLAEKEEKKIKALGLPKEEEELAIENVYDKLHKQLVADT